MYIFLKKYFLVYVYSSTVTYEELNESTMCHFHNVLERRTFYKNKKNQCKYCISYEFINLGGLAANKRRLLMVLHRISRFKCSKRVSLTIWTRVLSYLQNFGEAGRKNIHSANVLLDTHKFPYAIFKKPF